MVIHESAENYLESILILQEQCGEVHSIDIVNKLGYSKPSVSIAMKKLRENGEKVTFEITIREGRNRQIRRMCEAAELTVLRLCRVREGCISLGALAVGAWRYLTEEERSALYREVGL